MSEMEGIADSTAIWSPEATLSSYSVEIYFSVFQRQSLSHIQLLELLKLVNITVKSLVWICVALLFVNAIFLQILQTIREYSGKIKMNFLISSLQVAFVLLLVYTNYILCAGPK